MPAIIERLSDALAGRYRVERELGAGGMATVYLAYDLKHDRRVALKLLKPELAAVLGADRFVQEIKTTAALQHPHILPLFDSGTADGFLYYVMPFIDGETLRSRLNRETQLSIEEAVRLTVDVADALHYAHSHGVIHRDIKPENILLANGRPMVADFGIALAVSAAAGGRMTETGLSLGTPHYMSPEQATADKEIGARSDVYSLASVLYEMLAGQPPHLGGSAQQIIMKIIAEQAQPVTNLRKSVPPNVAAAVAKALEKLPADRFASAHEFAVALTNVAYAQPTSSALSAGAFSVSRARSRMLMPALAVATLVFAGLAAAPMFRPRATAPVVRYSMGLPPEQAMRQGVAGINLAISTDGKRFVYLGPGEQGDQLWLRERDHLDGTPLPGTAGGTNPYFSPDGSRIAFSGGGNFDLKVVSVAGGPPITLARLNGGSGGGGAWGPDGWIYFDSPSGLSRVRADGGTPEALVTLDSVAGEIGHAWPHALPNGKGLLYRSRRNVDPSDFDIVAFEFKTGERRVLTKGLIARYVAPGYLVFLRADGAVLAAPFDQKRLELTGPAVPLFEGVMTKALGSADLAISATGTLAYVPGLLASSGGVAEMVYVSREGASTPLNPAFTFNPSANRALTLSPDGNHVALDVVTTAGPDIRIKQLPNGPMSRLSFERLGATRPTWTADGRFVIYLANDATGTSSIWKKRADGSAGGERLWQATGVGEAVLSRDNQWLIFRTQGRAGDRDIFALRPGVDTVPRPLLVGPFVEYGAALSPNGKWLAYTSNESGQEEIYVRPFPNVSDGRWQISTRGGVAARWAHSGRELFFESRTSELMVAPVTNDAAFAAGEPQRLFEMGGAFLSSVSVPYYDTTPDDKRFVMVRFVAVNRAAGAGQLVVVDNWKQELLAKMGAH
jgi:eukaryotic-like serine/threonine-protein kinase